jgi:hypothetical protein
MTSILMETATNSRPIREAAAVAATWANVLHGFKWSSILMRWMRPAVFGGGSGQRTAAAGLPVAARRARSEVPVIAMVIAVAM